MLDAALAGFGLAYLPEDAGAGAHLPTGDLYACWPIGVRRFLATTSTIRAAASPRRRSRYWSMHCVTEVEAGHGCCAADVIRQSTSVGPEPWSQCSEWGSSTWASFPLRSGTHCFPPKASGVTSLTSMSGSEN